MSKNHSGYVYVESGEIEGLNEFAVGFFDPKGIWRLDGEDSTHNIREEAASRVSYLNGGRQPKRKVKVPPFDLYNSDDMMTWILIISIGGSILLFICLFILACTSSFMGVLTLCLFLPYAIMSIATGAIVYTNSLIKIPKKGNNDDKDDETGISST